ncbi:MAG: hypothetical protein ACK4YP_07525 [Myxococcota bacterium]
MGLVLLLVVLGPGLRDWTTVFLGRQYVDAWGTQWFYWFVGYQIRHLGGFGWTDMFFYPWGKDIYLHTGGNVLDAILAIPVRWVFGAVGGYNLFVVLVLVLNAIGMKAVAERMGADAHSARLAGVFFAFNPYALNEINGGRPTQVVLSFLLLYVLDLMKTGESKSPWAPVRAGIWLALTALMYWFYAFFGGLAAIGVVVWRLLSPREGDSRVHLVARHAAIAVVALAICGPFAYPMMSAGDEVPGMLDVSKWAEGDWMPTTNEGVSVGMYVFDPLTRMSGFWVPKGDSRIFLEEYLNLLIVQGVALVVGLLLAPKRWRGAGVALLVSSVLVALGPTLRIGTDAGSELPNHLYMEMVKSVSFLQRLWWPSRALVITHVAIGVCTAWVFAALAKRPVIQTAIVAATLAATVWELEKSRLSPMPVWSAHVPAGFRCLATGPEGAIIELPYAYDQSHLYYQTVHERPLLGGMVEDNPLFSPLDQIKFRSDNTFVKLLMDVAVENNDGLDYEFADRLAVKQMGYRYVILNKAAYVAPELQNLSRVDMSREGRLRNVRRDLADILGPPVFEDAEATVYAPFGDPSPCPGLEGSR